MTGECSNWNAFATAFFLENFVAARNCCQRYPNSTVYPHVTVQARLDHTFHAAAPGHQE